MSDRSATLVLCAAAVIVVGIAVPAPAQTPAVEVAARYQALYDQSIKERFPVGWSGDIAASLNPTWSIVADVGGAYRSDRDLDIDLSLHSVGGGMRWSGWRTSRVAPFAQLTAGLARMQSTAHIAGSDLRLSQTRVMLQPAAGVNIATGRAWGITAQAAYRRIFLNGDLDGDTAFNELSVSVGVRFGF